MIHEDRTDAGRSTTAQPIGKKALLIGIDRYRYLTNDAWLEGAANDVAAMADFLIARQGFRSEDVEILLDEQATRNGIIAAMDRLLARTQPGDAVVIAYSGHGSQVVTQSPYEGDGLEEVLFPHDSGRSPHPNQDLRGPELHAWLTHLAAITHKVTVVLDSCHSGTATRKLAAARVRRIEPEERPQGELPFLWKPIRIPSREKGSSGWLPLSEAYTLIAACRSDESAYELPIAETGGRAYGALTWFLLRQLETRANDTTLTFRDLFEPAAREVMRRFPDQHPQLEGAGDRLFLQLEKLTPMKYVPVADRRGRDVILRGGVLQGVERGSRWTIYPEGTRQETEAEPLGTVRVESVAGIESWAVLDGDEFPGSRSIQEGARAVRLAHGWLPGALRVAVEAPQRHEDWASRLIHHLDEAPTLEAASDLRQAEVIARILDPEEPDGAWHRRLTPLPGAVCALIERRSHGEGELLAPVFALTDPTALLNTLANLERRAAQQRLLSLTTPPASPLAGKIDCTLKRRGEASRFVPVEADSREGLIVFQSGEDFLVDITNRSDRDIFLYLVSLGADNSIAPIDPLNGSRKVLKAGRPLRVGGAGREKEFFLDESLPFDKPGSPRHAAIEHVQWIATVDETDLTPLFDEGCRDLQGAWEGEVAASSLGQHLAEVLLGRSLRGVRSGTSTWSVSWATGQWTILLRRP